MTETENNNIYACMHVRISQLSAGTKDRQPAPAPGIKRFILEIRIVSVARTVFLQCAFFGANAYNIRTRFVPAGHSE